MSLFLSVLASHISMLQVMCLVDHSMALQKSRYVKQCEIVGDKVDIAGDHIHQYPAVALRELAVNAVVHRCYAPVSAAKCWHVSSIMSTVR